MLIAVLPRIFRILYPYAWFEDSVYLYHAFTFKSGLKPFIQTLCVHPPTIEYLLAGLYSIFGVSYRVAELLTAIIIAFSATLLYDITRRVFDKYIALFVITSFSFSSLLFRYHIFEREIFTLAMTIFIYWLVATRNVNQFWALIIGFLVGMAFGIKFSGILIVPAIALYFILNHNYKTVLFFVVGFLISSFIIYGYFLFKYKDFAYIQLFLFHFNKGEGPAINKRFLDTFIRDLNYLWLIGGGGMICILFTRKPLLFSHLAIFILYTIFFLFISVTIWPHNMIDLLLPLSIGNGIGLFYLRKFIISPKNNFRPAIIIVFSIIVFLSLGVLVPKYYSGLGYIPRNEVKEVSRFIQANTSSQIPIHAPHYIANESRRYKIVDYEELMGPYILMLNKLEHKIQPVEDIPQQANWYQLVENTVHLWRYELNKLIMQNKISCAVWDRISPEWSLMYNIDTLLEKKSGLFSKSGYNVYYNTINYTVWLLQK